MGKQPVTVTLQGMTYGNGGRSDFLRVNYISVSTLYNKYALAGMGNMGYVLFSRG